MNEKQVREYLVEWRVSIAARSPREAAKIALEIQRDPESIATFFSVHTPEASVEIDLDLDEEE